MWLERKRCKVDFWGYGPPYHHQVLPYSHGPYPLPHVRPLEPLLQSFRAVLRLIVECLLSLPGRH